MPGLTLAPIDAPRLVDVQVIPFPVGRAFRPRRSLRVTFDDGRVRILDLVPSIQPGGRLEAVLDPAVFWQVSIDPAGDLFWPGGVVAEARWLHDGGSVPRLDDNRDLAGSENVSAADGYVVVSEWDELETDDDDDDSVLSALETLISEELEVQRTVHGEASEIPGLVAAEILYRFDVRPKGHG